MGIVSALAALCPTASSGLSRPILRHLDEVDLFRTLYYFSITLVLLMVFGNNRCIAFIAFLKPCVQLSIKTKERRLFQFKNQELLLCVNGYC